MIVKVSFYLYQPSPPVRHGQASLCDILKLLKEGHRAYSLKESYKLCTLYGEWESES